MCSFQTELALTEAPAVTKSRLSFGFLKRLNNPVEKLQPKGVAQTRDTHLASVGHEQHVEAAKGHEQNVEAAKGHEQHVEASKGHEHHVEAAKGHEQHVEAVKGYEQQASIESCGPYFCHCRTPKLPF
eukprot:1159207-Pelagomonas_calceolata.AAC.4